VTVDAEGKVIDVVVLSAKPPGWFEDAAISAVRRWRYKKADTGRRFTVEVEFKLE
jgi:protein TonB